MITVSKVVPDIATISLWKSSGLYEKSYESSMLKKIYERILDASALISDFSFIIATDSSSNIVGICVVEYQPPYSIQLKQGSHSRGKFKASLKVDKHFYVAGFMQVYVKPSHRNKGIARSMVIAMESEYLNRIQPSLVENAIPMLSGRGVAAYFIEQYMTQCFSIINPSFYGKKALFYSNFDKHISMRTGQFLNKVLSSFSFINPALADYVITPIK